jgi:hypothetical protein
MPGDPKECRLHARNCRKLAMTARTAEAADTFLSLAQNWDSLAAELESARIFLATMTAIDSDQAEPPKAA